MSTKHCPECDRRLRPGDRFASSNAGDGWRRTFACPDCGEVFRPAP